MKNSQKGFANIILIVVIVAIVAVGGYFVLSKKSTTPTPSQQNPEAGVTKEPNQGQGASFVPEQDRIQITSPKGGEKLEVGKTYDVRWTNYSGKEPLTIALQTTAPDNKVSAKIVTSNVPAVSTGSYKWTVTSESSEDKYKIEVYPAGGRELVGRSKDFFTISGGLLITITSPKPNDRVNLTQPVTITGKARNVFGEGEFDISASYLLDNQKKVVARTLATCNITGNGCDWTSGNFVDFKSTLDLSSSPVCYVRVEFYKRDDKTPQTQPFYVLPLYLFGNENCQPLVKSDDSVDTFVKNANFPKSSGVNVFINVPAQDLKVFKVSYGEPQDCPSGCFFSNATGIKYGNKIGWISINDYDQINVSKLIMYDFAVSDTYLYTDEFSQLLKSKDDWVYQNAFLPELAKDKDVPRNVLLKIANGLSSYIQPSLANNLLENSAVKNDREILTIIANLPVFSGDAYSEVRAKARALLK